MPFKRILLHICLWLLFPSWSAAQTIWTEEFPFAAELPSNEMTCIHQDRDGFIWTGTTNGLARYDGYRLQTFQANRHDPSRLTNNHITCLALACTLAAMTSCRENREEGYRSRTDTNDWIIATLREQYLWHETLNETNRMEVYTDVVEWLDAHT